MIITTLLNFWFAISAVIDPSIAYKLIKWGRAESNVSRTLKKHEPLELKSIAFGEFDPGLVNARALNGLGLLTLSTLKDVSKLEADQLRHLGHRAWGFAVEKIDAANSVIMQIQAELIIRQLNRLAESNGNPLETIDPYWAHYELFDGRNIVLVDSRWQPEQRQQGPLLALRLTYDLTREYLHTFAAMGTWFLNKIEVVTRLLENSGSAKNDLRHSCKPDFVRLKQEMSGESLAKFETANQGVHVANQRCIFVD